MPFISALRPIPYVYFKSECNSSNFHLGATLPKSPKNASSIKSIPIFLVSSK
ncbi:MAG TPA: hypothetical protein PLI27_09555 [Ignavibacteriales bacterium]|nr:hypothetical protein [Ignavibacteriales bacterium]HPD68305.1 hypothetical protein [Ignavibacteriales bacterium]